MPLDEMKVLQAKKFCAIIRCLLFFPQTFVYFCVRKQNYL